MGMIFGDVAFAGRAPRGDEIVDKIRAMTGLAVTAVDRAAEFPDMLYEMHLELSFVGFPGSSLIVYAYRPGAVAADLERTGMSRLPMAKAVEGADEEPGVRTVYFRGYLGQELTLYYATALALEALGGKLDPSVPDELRREYGTATTPVELGRRHKQVARRNRLMLLGGFAMLPMLLPVWVLQTLWLVVTVPGRVRRAHRAVAARLTEPPA